MKLNFVTRFLCLLSLSLSAGASEQLREAVAERAARDTARVAAQRDVRDALAGSLKAARAKQGGNDSANQQLRAAVAENAVELDSLREQLAIATADLADLMAAGRQTAGDLYAVRQRERVIGGSATMDAELAAVASASRPLTSADLKHVWLLLAEQISAISGVERITSSDAASEQLLRVGAFSAYDEGFFYALRGGKTAPLAISHESLPSAGNGAFYLLPADPTRGTALTALTSQPGTLTSLKSSGLIGAIIVALGVAGLAVVSLQLPRLLAVRRQMRRQSRATTFSNNPLGRLMSATREENPNGTLERALRREVAALERGQPLVRLLVAVAPLLGLLGTVTGMIVTFQTLGIYGSSDPTLMAGGISRALSTTALGLLVAVPLALLLALIRALSNSCVQMLEVYAARHLTPP